MDDKAQTSQTNKDIESEEKAKLKLLFIANIVIISAFVIGLILFINLS